MQVTVRTHHVDITSALKEYAQKKAEKLSRFFDNIQEVIVELDIQGVADVNRRQLASGTIFVPGSVIRAEESSQDLYASVDVLIDKLEKQLKKYKDKRSNRPRVSGIQAYFKGLGNGQGSRRSKTEDDTQLELNRHYVPKPMEPEDAAEVLLDRDVSFLVFRNAYTEKINVVYPLEEGAFGLIQP